MDFNEYVTGSGFNLGDLKANPSVGYLISLGKKAKSQFADPDDFDKIVNVVSKNWFSPFDDQIFKTLNNKVFAAIGGYIFLKLLYDRLYTIQNFQKSSKGVAHLRRNIRKTTLLLKRTGLWAFLPKNGIYNQAIPDKKKVVVPTNTLVERLGLKRSSPDTGITTKVQVTANKRPRIGIATNTQTTFSRVDTNQPVLNRTTTTLDYFGRPVWFKPKIQPLMSTTGQELQDLILINQNPIQQKMEKVKTELMAAIVAASNPVVTNTVAQALVTDIVQNMKPLLEALQKRPSETKYIQEVTEDLLERSIRNTLTSMGARVEQVKQSAGAIYDAVRGIIAKFVLETVNVNIPSTAKKPKTPFPPGNQPLIKLGDSKGTSSDSALVKKTLDDSVRMNSSNVMEAENNMQDGDISLLFTNNAATAAAKTAADADAADAAAKVKTEEKTEEPVAKVKTEEKTEEPVAEEPVAEEPVAMEEEGDEEDEKEDEEEGDEEDEKEPREIWDGYVGMFFHRTGERKQNFTYTNSTVYAPSITQDGSGKWWLQAKYPNGDSISPEFPIRKQGQNLMLDKVRARVDLAIKKMVEEFLPEEEYLSGEEEEYLSGEGAFTGGAEFNETYNIGEYLGYLGKMAQKVDTFYSMCDPAKQQIFRDLAENEPVMLGAVLEQKNSPTTALTITTLPGVGTTRLTVKTPTTGFTVVPMS